MTAGYFAVNIFDYIATTPLTTYRIYAKRHAASLIEGVLRRHPEGGARRGVLRRAPWYRSPPGAPGGRAVRPGGGGRAARTRGHVPAVVGRGARKETEARPRGPKPPRWSAERRASRVMGRKAPRKRLAYRVMIRPTGVPPSTRTSLGAPPTPRFGVSEATMQNPGRRNAPRE